MVRACVLNVRSKGRLDVYAEVVDQLRAAELVDELIVEVLLRGLDFAVNTKDCQSPYNKQWPPLHEQPTGSYNLRQALFIVHVEAPRLRLFQLFLLP
jgi:hypothetical protein